MVLFILCGLPGTGKSTFAVKIRNKFLSQRVGCIVVERDATRTGIINLNPGYLNGTLPLDGLERDLERVCFCQISYALDRGLDVIYDGCNVDRNALDRMLTTVKTSHPKTLPILVFIGSANSPCKHIITGSPSALFAEYDRDQSGKLLPSHAAIPKEVLDRKRAQFLNLFSNGNFSNLITKHSAIAYFMTVCPPDEEVRTFEKLFCE